MIFFLILKCNRIWGGRTWSALNDQIDLSVERCRMKLPGCGLFGCGDMCFFMDPVWEARIMIVRYRGMIQCLATQWTLTHFSPLWAECFQSPVCPVISYLLDFAASVRKSDPAEPSDGSKQSVLGSVRYGHPLRRFPRYIQQPKETNVNSLLLDLKAALQSLSLLITLWTAEVSVVLTEDWSPATLYVFSLQQQGSVSKSLGSCKSPLLSACGNNI